MPRAKGVVYVCFHSDFDFGLTTHTHTEVFKSTVSTKASFSKLKIFTDGKLGLTSLEDAKIAKIFDDLDVESGSNRNLTRADFLKFCHLIIFDAMLAEDDAAPAADA